MAEKIVTYEDVIAFANDPKVLMIDVRSPNELQETGVITGTINIPIDRIEETLIRMSAEEFRNKYGRDKPNADSELVFNCNSGGRATRAMNNAVSLGFSNVKLYKGGWKEWSSKQ